MRVGKLKKLLNLWHSNNLISEEQRNNIFEFMKERRKEEFFRMLKWFSIIGAFWLVFGFVMVIINLCDLFDVIKQFFYFMADIARYVFNFFVLYFWTPLQKVLYNVFQDKYPNFLWGILGFVLFFVFFTFSNMKKSDKNIDSLNISDEQKAVLKTNFALDALSVICLSSGFINFNSILINYQTFDFGEYILPVWNIVGAITLITLAYLYKRNMFLLFGIYFIALSAGMFTGCGYASYFLAVTQPVIQVLVGLILIAVGYISELKLGEQENFVQEKFISTYYWTGLLFVFLALWVATFWGFNTDNGFDPKAAELWLANILIIAASIGSMYWGMRSEKKIFFNYGLTFILIETYTIIFSHIFTTLPIGIASLILGVVLIGTAKFLKKMYLKKNIKGGSNELTK